MPVINNTGASVGLPEARFPRGATLVDESLWGKLQKLPAVQAHLKSGRFVLIRTNKTTAAATTKDQPRPVADAESSLPASIDKDGDGNVDVGALSAKAAIELVADMPLDSAKKALALETRKTVREAIEARIAELGEG